MSDVTQFQEKLAKVGADSAKLAGFFRGGIPPEVSSVYQKNIWFAMAVQAQNMYQLCAELSRDIVQSADTGQGPLFDIPHDRAAGLSQAREFFRRLESRISGDFIPDDTGRGDFDEPDASLFEPLSLDRRMFDFIAESDGLPEEDILGAFSEECAGGEDKAIFLAFFHLGMIADLDGVQVFSVTSETMEVDVEAALVAHPELGTDEGVSDSVIEDILLEFKVHKPDPVFEEDLDDADEGDDGELVDPETVDRMRSTEPHAVSGDDLVELYLFETGAPADSVDPDNLDEPAMRRAILGVRAKRGAQARLAEAQADADASQDASQDEVDP